MSREFRDVTSGYMHRALEDASETPGRHPISQALAKLYGALAPVENAAAGFEACDNGQSYVTITLQQQWATIEAALGELHSIYRQDADLIRALMLDREKLGL